MSKLVSWVRGKITHLRQHQNIQTSPTKAVQQPWPELHMVWPVDKIGSPPAWSVPQNYQLKVYQPGDEESFFILMERVGYPDWNQFEFQKYLQKIVPDGFYFLIHSATQVMAATAMGMHNPSELHPFGGSLSCVGVDPDHQGQHLGAIISAIVTERLIQGQYKDIYLTTDDWRLPAIKTYFNLGWLPFLFGETITERWKRVCQDLNWSFTPDQWPAAPQSTPPRSPES